MGANTFPSHNQSLTLEYLTRPVNSSFLVTLNQILSDNFQNHQTTMKSSQRCASTCDNIHILSQDDFKN
jgi:hypothetical protein